MRCVIALALSLVLLPACSSGQSDPEQRFQLGLQKMASGEYDEAIDIFQSIVDQFAAAGPRSVQALMQVGRYDDAEAQAERLAALDSAPAGLSVAYGDVLAARGKLTPARTAFSNAMRTGGPDSLVAALKYAAVLREQGQVDSAMARFDGFIDLYNRRNDLSSEELTAIATAAQHLGANDWNLYQDAIRVYGEAAAANPTNVEPLVREGELFLEKYDNRNARAVLNEALALNGSHPGALVALAKSHHFDGSPKAMSTVQRSLEINPNYVPARTFLARLYVELEDYEAAEAEIDRALGVNPNSLEALSVLAAVRYLTSGRSAFEEVEQRVLSINPRYADLYSTLAELSARNRLYGDAVEFAQQGFALDDKSWRALGLLGMNQMRTGEVDEGRQNLEIAFDRDPFNVWIKNTLDLADTFSEYETVRRGRFVFVVHNTEADLLVPYLAEVAEDAYEQLARRYAYEAPTPIRLEVYPRHADFSVRTVGLAGLGALGVSFGPVLAMDSPSARPSGDFNWGSTLWHEIAHSFHLGLSGHKVPRWFTEGLAVFEERNARTGWGEDITVSFVTAYRDGKVPPVSQLNNGFVRPAYPEQVIHSYYQASLVCEYIEQERGATALVEMLQGFRDGRGSADVLEAVMGMNGAAFDRAFDEYLKQRLAGPLTALANTELQSGTPIDRSDPIRFAEQHPNSFPVQLAVGRMLFDDGQLSDAIPLFERAKTLFPEYAAPDSPYWYLAAIHKEQDRPAEAVAELTAHTAINARHLEAFLALADVKEQLGDSSGAADALARAMYIYPFDIPSHTRLAELFGSTDDWAGAVRERNAVVALDPVDKAEARYQLASAYFQAGDHASARREVLRTLEEAPNFARAQDLLLQIGRRN